MGLEPTTPGLEVLCSIQLSYDGFTLSKVRMETIKLGWVIFMIDQLMITDKPTSLQRLFDVRYTQFTKKVVLIFDEVDSIANVKLFLE